MEENKEKTDDPSDHHGGINTMDKVTECLDALIEENIYFKYCIGVSAGISNGISYISRQKGRNLEVLLKYRHDSRYISRRNFLRNSSIQP